MDFSEIKALTFDVFGTVVDWRGSIIGEGEDVWAAKGVEVDWPQFADNWRGGYGPAMHSVRTGELPWMNIDALHRLILDDLLKSHQVSGLSEADTQELNRVWHRLNPVAGCCLRSWRACASTPSLRRCPMEMWPCWSTWPGTEGYAGTVSFLQSWPSITSRTRKCTRWRPPYWGWSLAKY